MKMRKAIPLAVSLAGLLFVVGCSSSSGSSNSTPTLSGTAIDGLIAGAVVCVDVDKSNTCNTVTAGTTGIVEDFAKTDINGKYSFVTSQEGNLLLVGGKDTGTGKDFKGTLSAPAGSTVVTPLTSMIVALVDDNTSAAQAEATLKTALGIDSSVALTTFDPFVEAEGNNTKAKAVLAAQAQIQTLVHAASASVAGAASTKTITNVMSSVTKSIAKSIKEELGEGNTSITITSTIVEAATKEAAAEVFAENPTAKNKVDAIASSAASAAVTIADETKATITNLSDADVSQGVAKLNAGMVLANGSLETELKKQVEDGSNVSVADTVKAERTAAETTASEAATALADAKSGDAAKVKTSCDKLLGTVVDGVCTFPKPTGI